MGSCSKIVGMTLQQHDKGAGIYVTINETNGNGRHADQITRIRAIWQEDDSGYDGKLPLEPSIVVETSPGHRHRYWLVRDHWPADEQGRRDFDGVMARMVADYGSDKNAKDISRVLRVPGFLHRKNPAAPHLVQIIEANEKRYTRAELLAAFPPIERKHATANGKDNAFTNYASPTDIERVRDALSHIPADDRKVWLEIGMALKHEFGDGGRELFNEWSETSDKYDARDQDVTWRHLGKRDGITIATLFHHAKEAGWTGDADDARVAALGRMSELAYQKQRKAAAKEIGIKADVLDKLVRKARAQAQEEADELPHWSVEPWSEPVDTAALLTGIERMFRHYIVLPQGAAEALALWTLHAWTMDADDVSPFMVLVSPTKRCGKTSVLVILYYLTPRSELASNISPSAFYRYIEETRPTLLIDEADSFVKDNEELRGILNSGHTRAAAYVIRNVEVNGEHKPRRFSTWAPKAIATIRALADTIEDRSIVVTLQRKPRTAPVARLRKRDSDEFATLRRQAARWAEDNAQRLADPDPAMPEVLNDRAADNWRPLLAIADLAGDTWARRAREAACVLSGEGHDTAVNVELLVDVKAAFDAEGKDAIFSADLVERLTEDPERPWAEWSRGKPLTQKQLVTLLKPFLVFSRSVRLGQKTGKGYKRESFEAVWAAYLPGQNTPSPHIDTSETSQHHNADKSSTYHGNSSVTDHLCSGSKTGPKPLNNNGCRVVAFEKPEPDARGESATREAPEAGAKSRVGGGKAYRDRYRDKPEDIAARRAMANRRCAFCDKPEGPGDSLWPATDDDNKTVFLHAVCLSHWQGDLKKRRRVNGE
jgi:Protein of unknown function (DUF3631)/Primase C terminal 2 (PriCT-2)/RepB DNA-primase from phage plasmid